MNRLACWGVKMIRDFTLLFGVPGITLTKSITNSAWLWVMMARLHIPFSYFSTDLYV